MNTILKPLGSMVNEDSTAVRNTGMADKSKIPVPKATPETQHFWDGTKAGVLRLQRCCECSQIYFPPRPFCPACVSRDVEVFDACGRAFLYSYVINQRPHP
ncbi:MAG: zinc ribbon domain-containing protein, partial [Pseudomonadales bacterium]|nr:zinc ribbon domain-containing protein [Pseudomonadales bacterium]